MSYIKQQDFIDIATDYDCDAAEVLAELKRQNPNYGCNITHIQTRINNYRQKGLLPLDTGVIIDPSTVLAGMSVTYDGLGNIKRQTVRSVVPKSKYDHLGAFTKAVEELIDGSDFSYSPVEVPEHLDEDLLTIYPIGDAHVGMLAHAAEVGEDHDLKISKERHLKAITLAVDQAPKSFEAFIIDVGDWQHMDDSSNRTARGNNPLDVDGRYHKVVETSFEIAVGMIEAALHKHNTVHWRSSPGNHNEHSSIMLSYFLRGYFRNEPRVNVHCSPSMFFYHQFGSNLIGVTHGHTTKAANLPGIMATDEPQMWGTTKNRYWYLGHLHHDIVKEMPGCKLETFRTLASKDQWHHASGYRSGQDLKTITLHKEHGEVSRNTFNLSLINT